MANAILRLVDNQEKLEFKIRQALLKDINKTLTRARNSSLVPIRNLITKAILRQPEVLSLDSGELAGEFGLKDGLSKIENIILEWTRTLSLRTEKIKIVNNQLVGGLTLHAIRSDYQDVLSHRDATIQTIKGQNLPWLEWLLLFGDKAIIRNYKVLFKKGRSRSGLAVMVKSQGESWGVDSDYSGVAGNNFVTRAMEGIEDELVVILEKNFERFIGG